MSSVTLSLDGTRLVSGSADKTVCIWDAKTGAITTGPFNGHTNDVSFVAFIPDNKHIFSVSFYSAGMIYIWDIETGAIVSWKHPFSIYSVAFSLDGQHAVLGSFNEVHIADAETGTIICGPFRGHTDTVSSVTISLDGTLVASGSHDNTICVWDVETGENVFGLLPGHTEWVLSVAFSQDGKRVMSFSYAEMIRIWNIERRELISTHHGTVAVPVSIPPLTICIFF